MPTAVIVGASSGIGRCLATHLSARGYDLGLVARRELGLVARREQLLRELAQALPGRSEIEALDVADLAAVRDRVPALVRALGQIDLYVFCAGIGHLNPTLAVELELETIAVNVQGFVNATAVMAQVFERQGSGHIVGISSIAALRGGAAAPAYGASKVPMARRRRSCPTTSRRCT